ncbi:phenylalanine--tRNA ligase subunit beta [candidate division KSB1 bacterium RBG_16_48_16]|nr:MAG: phenylalanine--tRNA ligase subunit beta [candidate division KSB1 bacterium RBG_16_48_16]
MIVTLNWLKEFVEINESPRELANLLTMGGLEVEEYHTAPGDFSGIVVGEIISAKPHPEMVHLFLCEVVASHKKVTVLCGAPNVAVGVKAPLAMVGSTIAQGITIKKKEFQGLSSEGMLCSEAELGLTERADEIMVLPSSLASGSDLGQYLGEPDVVFDIAVTPNRPDCLSVIGIARQIAALKGLALKVPQLKISDTQELPQCPVKVEINNVRFCKRYSGRLLEDVRIKASPFWLAQRLHAVGIRSINNVVDITNYVMMECGQPLHAFDFRFLQNQKIIVRTAGDKETFTTLDGQDHVLDSEALLICDGRKPVALAGIMGGQNSEVQDDTTAVFLESANFDPVNVRRTSKKLGLSTESSRRFERGVDPNGTVYAMNRAAELMVELAGARISSGSVDNYPERITGAKITLTAVQTNNLLGTELSQEDIERYLKNIGLDTRRQNAYIHVSVPTYRPDLLRDVDLIEEISILHGFDNIPARVVSEINQLQPANDKAIFKDSIRTFLSGIGFCETANLSLVYPDLAKYFLPNGSRFVELLNPLSADLSVFRPAILLSLMNAVAYNRNRQHQNLMLYEIGNAGWKNRDNNVVERTQIACILAGKRNDGVWFQKAEPFDYFDMKGIAHSFLLKFVDGDVQFCESREKIWGAENSGLQVNEHYIGAIGKLSDEICAKFKIRVPDLFGMVLDFEDVYSIRKIGKKFSPIPKYPSVPFDLAISVENRVPYQDVEQTIWQAGGEYLRKVQLFDLYRGEQIDAQQKSLAFSLTFFSQDRTLDDEEVDKAVQNILANLKEKFAAELRLR